MAAYPRQTLHLSTRKDCADNRDHLYGSSLLAVRKPNLKLAKHPDDPIRCIYLPGHIVLHSEFRNSRIRSVNMDPS